MGKSHEMLIKQLTLNSRNMRNGLIAERQIEAHPRCCYGEDLKW